MALIMIVDDDALLHRVLDKILSMKNHEICAHAYDGADAIDKFKECEPKPDLILMDHRMPIMNGTTATAEILAIDKKVRILFISADETVKEVAMESGAVGFLTKPIRSSQLYTAIDQNI